jgi:hypothetical protein
VDAASLLPHLERMPLELGQLLHMSGATTCRACGSVQTRPSPDRIVGTMPPLSAFALALAELAVACVCTFMDGRAGVPPPAEPLKGSFEAAAPFVAERATRNYVDDNGTIRDDGGRKQGTGS